MAVPQQPRAHFLMFRLVARSRPRIIKPASFTASFATSPFDIPGADKAVLSPIHASVYTSIRRPVPPMPHSPMTVKIQGPNEEAGPDHESHLQDQLQSIQSDTKYLRLDEDTPSDKEWTLLSAHFSRVENLELDSGFNEDLNDKHIPQHWPLRRLELRSACGQLVQSPFILQGRVSHLSLLLTGGLRFAGSTNSELLREHKEQVERGEIEAEYITHNQGTPEEKRLQVIYMPSLVCRHMNKLHSGLDGKSDPEDVSSPDQINLHTLEIFENDAIDTFCRLTMDQPHLVNNLQTLRIRSTSGLDFIYLDEGLFRFILPQLVNLKTLNLTVGDVFNNPSYLPTLHEILPPNLTTLFFRGPASLCQSEHWSGWLRAFESKEFLPQLQRLAFVLDLHHEEKEGWSRKRVVPAPANVLYQARVACEDIYGTVKRRGVSIVEMPAEPEAENDLFEPVDDRW
ncbi:hypothetical protein N7497_009464 [Penicillium chrysogenum]|jgi:hypothetical protein|nr:hypothetical protein N7497_009464 [Penicillium chrysogenum]